MPSDSEVDRKRLVNALNLTPTFDYVGINSRRSRRLLQSRERHREQIEKVVIAQYVMRILKRAAQKVCQAGSAAAHAAAARAGEVRRRPRRGRASRQSPPPSSAAAAHDCARPSDWTAPTEEMQRLVGSLRSYVESRVRLHDNMGARPGGSAR